MFTRAQRSAYFAVTDDIRKTMAGLRTATTKVGFLLQLGYFKHSGKFFEKSVFRQRDIKFVKKQLNLTAAIDLAEYRPSRMTHHQSRVLELSRQSSGHIDAISKIGSGTTVKWYLPRAQSISVGMPSQ